MGKTCYACVYKGTRHADRRDKYSRHLGMSKKRRLTHKTYGARYMPNIRKVVNPFTRHLWRLYDVWRKIHLMAVLFNSRHSSAICKCDAISLGV